MFPSSNALNFAHFNCNACRRDSIERKRPFNCYLPNKVLELHVRELKITPGLTRVAHWKRLYDTITRHQHTFIHTMSIPLSLLFRTCNYSVRKLCWFTHRINFLSVIRGLCVHMLLSLALSFTRAHTDVDEQPHGCCGRCIRKCDAFASAHIHLTAAVIDSNYWFADAFVAFTVISVASRTLSARVICRIAPVSRLPLTHYAEALLRQSHARVMLRILYIYRLIVMYIIAFHLRDSAGNMLACDAVNKAYFATEILNNPLLDRSMVQTMTVTHSHRQRLRI